MFPVMFFLQNPNLWSAGGYERNFSFREREGALWKPPADGVSNLRFSNHSNYHLVSSLTSSHTTTPSVWSYKASKNMLKGEFLHMGHVLDCCFYVDSSGFSAITDCSVWEGCDRILDLIQESHEHTKAITILAISKSGEKLYSGSLDKIMRVWNIRDVNFSCVEVHDMKGQVRNPTVANTIACFIPQGAGVKEIDLATGTSSTIQAGNILCFLCKKGLFILLQESGVAMIRLSEWHKL